MKNGPFIFVGIFFAMAASWLAFALAPQLQIGSLQQGTNIITSDLYPNNRPGLAKQGAEIYRANGCVACHTQQIRPGALGYDLDRGWGRRMSVAQDYIFDQPVMLGSQRIGPDLANIGARQDARTMLLHLYNPRVTMPGSIMPPYRFLFEKRKISRAPSLDALNLPEAFAPEKNYEVVPRPEARALVAYLSSLRPDAVLYETPMPQPKLKVLTTNAPAATAPVTATNSPAKK